MKLTPYLDPNTLRYLADDEQRAAESFESWRARSPWTGPGEDPLEERIRDAKARARRYRSYATRVENLRKKLQKRWKKGLV